MRNVIGIAAEYNPFHNGHALHLEETRAILGAACPVVCVMSGDFAQRGTPAVYSKFARAEAAVRCGVDLVLELPLPWSLASAEGFARGAVGLLGSLGVVTHLSFGSRWGRISALSCRAACRLPRRGRERSHAASARWRSCWMHRTTFWQWNI